LKALIIRHRYFFFPVLLTLITGFLLVFIYDKASLHIAFNTFHAPALDLFFKFLTYLGDGWMVLVLSIVFLFIRYRYVMIFLISNLFITLVVQISKKLIFTDALRPVAFFEDLYDLYLVPGVDIHSHHSFPSGHAATAFGIFMMLTLVSRKASIHVTWAILAVITAFSRVYLSQHFLVDICVGALIGIIITFTTYHYFNIFVPRRLNGSLLDMFYRKNGPKPS
jgi:membrane-associated phospholipid phosphatase